MRAIFAVVTGIVFLLAASTQDLRAAAADPGSAGELHVVGTAELHDAVVASSAEAAAARQSVQDFLARSEVQSQIEQMGFEPADIESRVALLSDSEILRLQSQMMSTHQQIRTAGIPGWAVLVVVAGIILVLLIILGSILSDYAKRNKDTAFD
jgi:hypothetical protein